MGSAVDVWQSRIEFVRMPRYAIMVRMEFHAPKPPTRRGIGRCRQRRWRKASHRPSIALLSSATRPTSGHAPAKSATMANDIDSSKRLCARCVPSAAANAASDATSAAAGHAAAHGECDTGVLDRILQQRVHHDEREDLGEEFMQSSEGLPERLRHVSSNASSEAGVALPHRGRRGRLDVLVDEEEALRHLHLFEYCEVERTEEAVHEREREELGGVVRLVDAI